MPRLGNYATHGFLVSKEDTIDVGGAETSCGVSTACNFMEIGDCIMPDSKGGCYGDAELPDESLGSVVGSSGCKDPTALNYDITALWERNEDCFYAVPTEGDDELILGMTPKEAMIAAVVLVAVTFIATRSK